VTGVAGLHVDGPAEFGELFLDIGKCVGERGAAMRVGGALGEDALALELERLALALAVGVERVGGCWIRFRGGGLRLLLFH